MRPIKRSSIMGPWGVGAMVPFPNGESLMIAGLDVWDYKDFEGRFLVDEPRLCRRLGVSELRLPPDFRDSRTNDAAFLKIPAVRFPRWYYCPVCGLMQKVTSYSELPRCQGDHGKTGKRRPVLLPETAVVACCAGHIDDFPVDSWLHEKCGKLYDPSTCRIYRHAKGNVASTSDIDYECSCGAHAFLGGTMFATTNGAELSFPCSGAMPWLGVESSPCNETARLHSRGETNLWQGETKSSLFIPTTEEVQDRRVTDVLGTVYKTLSEMKRAGQDVVPMLQFTALNSRVDTAQLISAFERRFAVENSEDEKHLSQMSEDEYRQTEYGVLIKSSGDDTQPFHSIACNMSSYSGELMDAFSSISLVPKLKETRAFIGFSRDSGGRRGNLSLIRNSGVRQNWLPAIAVYGEGLFFAFNLSRLKAWASLSGVRQRIARLQDAYQAGRYANSWLSGGLRPEFVCIHTFAHLLINQLTFVCGYGAASLRERVYCGAASGKCGMAGVLIYTASGDADGSLGGLVSQGSPGRLEILVSEAIENARWCSRDPICIQSKGQGPGSCNLAACHSCALLPETSCEFGNTLLDRGLVIGTMDDPRLGFFNGQASHS